MHVITKAAAAVFGGALLAGVVAGTASPVFAAGTPDKITVHPGPAIPYEPVMVSDGGQCHTGTGNASSMAFSAPAALRRAPGGRLSGRTTIRSGAMGTYPVVVMCGTKDFDGWITVVKKPPVKPVRNRMPGAVTPAGSAPTGDGTTSSGTDAAMAKTGLAVTGVGAILGIAALIRRVRGR
jgi:hypothetical protein